MPVSKSGQRHYSTATMAKLRERGRKLAKEYGFKPGHNRQAKAKTKKR